MRFLRREAGNGAGDGALPPDLSARISNRAFCAHLGMAALGGVLFALALPPLNWSILAVFTLMVLVFAVIDLPVWKAALCGYAWGFGWSIPAFFWLREIHPAVPYLLAPVISLWPMVWAATVPVLRRALLVPPSVRFEGEEAIQGYLRDRLSIWRIFWFSAVLAGWWVVLEYTRSTMLPWNNLSTAMWREARLLPLAAFTGQYGIGFLIALTGITLALGMKYRNGLNRMRLVPAFGALILTWLLPELASAYLKSLPAPERQVPVRIGLVQGDISQRRNASTMQAEEALDIYLDLTRKLLARTDIAKPDVVVWPETAVPYPFKGAGDVCARFRSGVHEIVQKNRLPMFFGTIDYALSPDGDSGRDGITNSALLISPEFREAARYDKIHRVPFGEYIPFRSFLPGFLIRVIDMNRDLVPGRNLAPVEIAPQVRAGVAICFESVFPCVAREEARRGANMLLVVSNDAWYPTSSEPEQHLANAVMRSVETGLYAVRCGNNGGTLVVSPEGKVVQVLETPGEGRPEIRRGRAAGVLELSVPAAPRLTVHTRYGDWFILFSSLLFAAAVIQAAWNEHALKRLYCTLIDQGESHHE